MQRRKKTIKPNQNKQFYYNLFMEYKKKRKKITILQKNSIYSKKLDRIVVKIIKVYPNFVEVQYSDKSTITINLVDFILGIYLLEEE